MTAVAEPGVVAAGREVLPGFRVEALLARGSRVDTYDVTDLDRDCRAVVKVIRPDRLDEPHVRAAVRTEGELLTRLAHPHLVRGYAVLDEPAPAIVMETVPGATLAAVLDDQALGVHDIALVGRQLASVLGYLHRRDWLHLDVKPENVVVQQGRVVLIDLGLATRPGRLDRAVGTDGYAAPEQEPGEVVSPATDVWGLGGTLYECVTREAPGRTPDLGSLPAVLAGVVADCLRHEPAERPSLAEVSRRLDVVLTDAPLRETWSSRVRRRRWRRPRTPR